MENSFRTCCSEHIAQLIEAGVRDGSRTATVSDNWEIRTAVRIPSDFTLILENCHLRMADNVFSNLFVNEHHDTEAGRTISGTDRNITIIGRGSAVIDGGTYNGLSEKTQYEPGMPPIWKNNLILFTNVSGFRITGVHCRNQRWWALNFIYCSDGYLGDLDFCANDISIDKNGNIYHKLDRSVDADVLVKNADGIDIRQGCHDILIENITGFTEDDSVAVTGLTGRMENTFAVEGIAADIRNIEVRNIATASFCTNVRLLNQGGIRMHDIFVDGVEDTSKDSPHMEVGLYAVRIGDNRLYGERHSTCEETYNITVRNVRGRGTAVVSLAGAIANLEMSGIESIDGAELLIDERTEAR